VWILVLKKGGHKRSHKFKERRTLMISLSWTDKRSRIVTVRPGCGNLSWLGRPTFSPPFIIPPWKLFKSLANEQTLMNHHHPSRVVTICPDRDDLPTVSPLHSTNMFFSKFLVTWQTVKGCYHPSQTWWSADMAQTDKRWWAVKTCHRPSPVWRPVMNWVYCATLQSLLQRLWFFL